MSAAPRYEALVKLASGGMASVWIGTARGALGFRQLVAIKKPHPHLLEQPGFREELIAEARLASMIRHANVVDVRDVEEDGDSISLVMDFIEGASLGEVLVAASKRNGEHARIPPRVAVRILRDACAGLHAAHELTDEKSRWVGLVHRDISPQNILVGEDGISRVTDFGVAKFAKKNMASTSAGSLKGKLAYMAPEYLRSEPIDRRFDVFAAGVVLWEALTGMRCFRADSEAETFRRILEVETPPVSSIVPALAPLDSVVQCALEKSPKARFQNAAAMGAALENAATEAGLFGSHTEVSATLKELLGPAIEERRARVRAKLAHEPSLASMGADTVMTPVRDDDRAPKTEPVPSAPPREDEATRTAERSEEPPPSDTLRDDAPPITQPITTSAYEVASFTAPPKPRSVVPFIVAGGVVAALALIGGVTLGRLAKTTTPAVTPSASASTPTSISTPPVPPTSAPPPERIPDPVVTASSRLATPKPKIAAEKASATASALPATPVVPSASTKRPPANPYE